MTRLSSRTVLAALALVFVFSSNAAARADDFDAVVRNVRAACGGRKVRVPLLGLAGFATRIVRPAGVKSFKLAVFEGVTRAGNVSGLGAAIRESLGTEWRPLVRARRGAEQTHVYVRDAGDNLKLMIVTLGGEQATVIRAEVSPEAVARFARDPKVLGIPLGDK